MSLPIPTTLRGWAAAALILIFLFTGYYGCFFTSLQNFYAEKLFFTKNPQQQPHSEEILAYVDVPSYVAPFGQRWVYFKIQNRSQYPVRNTSVWMEIQRPDELVDRQNLPFLFGSSMTKSDMLTFEQIPPNGMAHGRLPFFTANPGISTEKGFHITVTIWISYSLASTTSFSNPITPTTLISIPISGEVQVNPMRFLAHSFIEQILLPPWSNGFIVFVVFVACALTERRLVERRPAGRTRWQGQFWEIFYPSFMVVSFAVGFAFILPYLPWIWSWPWRWSVEDISSWRAIALFAVVMVVLVLKSLKLLEMRTFLQMMVASLVQMGATRRIAGKVGPFIPLFTILVISVLIRRGLPPLLQPLVPILWGTLGIETCTQAIEVFQPMLMPQSSGGKKWKEKKGTSRRPQGYFQRLSRSQKSKSG